MLAGTDYFYEFMQFLSPVLSDQKIQRPAFRQTALYTLHLESSAPDRLRPCNGKQYKSKFILLKRPFSGQKHRLKPKCDYRQLPGLLI